MPTCTRPTPDYALAEWMVKPANTVGLKEGEWEPYDYVTGETLESIALRISQPGKTVAAGEIAMLNWGTAVPEAVNYYLRDYNGCRPNSTDTAFLLQNSDGQPWLWVPIVKQQVKPGKFRPPGIQDVGHVAPDHDPGKHINTIVIPPVYSITLELGDIDALFDPINPATDATSPWQCKGVRERLQVLGYLYTHLGDTRVVDHARKCWKYYKMVHDRKVGPGSDLSNAVLLAKLKTETRNNLLTRSFPKSGAIFRNSKLPDPDQFGVIRHPGGYCLTWPRPMTTNVTARASDPDAKYDYTFDEPPARNEDLFWADNPLLGKFPLIATVHKLLPDGRVVPAEGVAVYFQLAEPKDLPAEFKAPDTRNVVMDYAKMPASWNDVFGGAALKNPPMGVNKPDWDRARELTPNAFAAAARGRNAHIDGLAETQRVKNFVRYSLTNKNPPLGTPDNDPDWAQAQTHTAAAKAAAGTAREQYVTRLQEPPEVQAALRKVLEKKVRGTTDLPDYADAPPFEIENAGPKKYIDDLYKKIEKEATDIDDKDPQRRNAPKKYGGKGAPQVANNVFEIGTERPGLHTPRGPHHRDYGKMQPAEAVEPEGSRHKYAVLARTNEKGHACVAFMPSRCGGDRYRLRAYVGPETLEFPTDPDFPEEDLKGPVVETGTMVVWRNIRLYRYLQKPMVAIAGLGPETRAMLEWPRDNSGSAYKGKRAWAESYKEMKFDSGLVNVQITREWPAEAQYLAVKPSADANKWRHRTVNVYFVSLEESFNQCYCELISDHVGLAPEPMPQALYEAAIREGCEAAERSGKVGKPIHWPSLVFSDMASPYLLNLRHWTHYNHLKSKLPSRWTKGASQGGSWSFGSAYPDLTEADESKIQSAIDPYMIEQMIRTFGDGGVYPGLTLVQVMRGDTWEDYTLQGAAIFTSGIATAARGAFIFYSVDIHRGPKFCYAATSNALHELAHSLLGEHQPPSAGGSDPSKHETHMNDARTTPNPGDRPCVLSYTGCYGEFCGRCVMRMRGWLSLANTQSAGV